MASRPAPWPLRLYPGWWRIRYGDEMSVVLEAATLRPMVVLDLLRGALDAHLIGDGRPSSRGRVEMLVAGGSWTVIGAATAAAPTPPDWPGYSIETLPIGVVGAAAVLGAVLAVGRRGWGTSGRAIEILLPIALLTHLAWAGALVVAAAGGPYGPITAAIQSAAAITTVGVGVERVRTADHPVGELALIAGVAFLMPRPAAWLLAGAAWTALGLVILLARPHGDHRGTAR